MTANYCDHPENLDAAAILQLNSLYAENLPPLGPRLLEDLVSKASYFGPAFSGRKGSLVAFDQSSDLDTIYFQCKKAMYDRFLYVERLAVHPACQRTGAGRGLLHDLAEYAVAEDHTHIACTVLTRPPNWAAYKLFSSSAFATMSENRSDEGAEVETRFCRVLPPHHLATVPRDRNQPLMRSVS